MMISALCVNLCLSSITGLAIKHRVSNLIERNSELSFLLDTNYDLHISLNQLKFSSVCIYER